MKLAVAQHLCQPGDVAGNLARMERLLAQCIGCRLVLFSEAGVTGYTPTCPTVTIGDATCRRLHGLARQYETVVAAGFLERRGAACDACRVLSGRTVRRPTQGAVRRGWSSTSRRRRRWCSAPAVLHPSARGNASRSVRLMPDRTLVET